MTKKSFNVAGNFPAFGGWITIDSPVLCHVMAGAGFDYLCIDTQHSLIGVTEAAHLLYGIPRGEVPVLVRTPRNDPADIGKMLDCGADGIIVPMINTPAEAVEASRACAYPPEGIRSFGPIRSDLPRAPKLLNERAACFAMIETLQGAECAEAIAAVEGIAGLYLGPADLAISLGLQPDAWRAPPVQEAVRNLVAACRTAGKLAAGHALSSAQASDMVALGMDMVSLTSDKGLITMAARTMISELRETDRKAPS